MSVNARGLIRAHAAQLPGAGALDALARHRARKSPENRFVAA